MSEENMPSPKESNRVCDGGDTVSEESSHGICSSSTNNSQQLQLFESGSSMNIISPESERVIQAVELPGGTTSADSASISAASDLASIITSGPSRQSGDAGLQEISGFQANGEGVIDADDRIYGMEFEIVSLSEFELNRNPIENESSSEFDEDLMYQAPNHYPVGQDHEDTSCVADNLADEESDSSGSDKNTNFLALGLGKAKKVPKKCRGCRTFTLSVSRYCLRCFMARRNWLPKRPKLAKNRNKSKRGLRRSSIHNSTFEETTLPTKLAVSSTEELEQNCFKPLTEVNLPSSSTSSAFQAHSISSNLSQDLVTSWLCASSQTSQSPCGSQQFPVSQENQKSFQGSYGPTSSSCKSPTKKERRAREKSLILEATSSPENQADTSMVITSCDICSEREKDAAFVHNKIAHQFACFSCAQKILKQTGRCPVCGKRVLRVVKVIDA